MPELTWIGKDKVVNHHHDVPFRILEKQYSYGAENSGNRIIHGDNLEALKSLLPEYENRVKCIYIDPPYNTGNEGWVYNDNVNDPKLKRWLNQVVGKEGEDLSRHDKWLCMMYPRLKLLRRLLSDDGSIWISIDDSEVHSLRMIMDEIFGRQKFIASNVWQKRYSRENREAIGDVHEYIVVYAKNPDKFKEIRNRIALDEKQTRHYTNPNNDPRGPWQSISMTAQGYRPNQMYTVTAPNGREHTPPEGRCWSLIESEYQKLVDDNKIWFGKDGNGVPRVIRYRYEVDGLVPWTWWPHEEVGHTGEAKIEIRSLFGTQTAFDTPKPVRLIERIIHIATGQEDLVLDSFAGSGTTAQAVINLNARDEGTRKFILIEQEDYAETVTAQRCKLVIGGYGSRPSSANGLGGGFDYYEIGPPLFLAENVLNEDIGITEIRKYIAFTEGIEPADSISYFLGSQDDMSYYFYYERDESTTLDLEFLSGIKTRPKRMLIYADRCLLSKQQLADFGITFKKIPRDITRF